MIEKTYGIVNRAAFLIGWFVGRIAYALEGFFEWLADGWARGRDGLPLKVEPPKPVEPRKPLIDLSALSLAVRRRSEGPESHGDESSPVSGTTTPA